MAKRDRKPGEESETEAFEVEEEEVAAVEEAAGEESETENHGLVKMRKGDETLHVHPSTVKAHQDAGWETVY